MSKRAAEYEGRMRDLEVCCGTTSADLSTYHCIQSRLSHQLDDFRKVDSDLQQALRTLQVSLSRCCVVTYLLTSFQVNSKRGDRALTVQVPRIQNELDDSMEALTKLGVDLPHIRSQVNTIVEVYLSGHATVSPSILGLANT